MDGTTRLGVSHTALTEDEAFKRLGQIMGANKSPPSASNQDVPAIQQEQYAPSAPLSVDTQQFSEPEPQDDFPNSLIDLAQRLEVDPDRIKKLKTKVKVDGTESEATLQDLIKSYQLEGHLTNKSAKLSDRAREMESEYQRKITDHQQREQELGNRIKEASNVIGAVLEEVANDYKGVNWEELRVDNPAEWSARQMEMKSRYDRIYQRAQSVEAEIKRQQTENQQKYQQSHNEFLRTQTNLLLQKMPELANESIAQQRGAELNEYLQREGFTKDEILGIKDHRQIITAFKAIEAEKLKTEMSKARESAKLKLKTKTTEVQDTGIRAATEHQRGTRPDQSPEMRSRFENSRSTRDGVDLVKKYLQKR